MVFEKGGGGRIVGKLKVGKLNVGTGGLGFVVRTGGTINVVFRTGGTGKEDVIGGIGLVVGTGGRAVVLRAGGEGPEVGRLSVGRLKEGKLGDGKLSVGTLSVGRLREEFRIGDDGFKVGRLDVGRGVDVRKGGVKVEFRTGEDGFDVGRLGVGRGLVVRTGGTSVELSPGGDGCKGGRLNVGEPGRLVSIDENHRNAEEEWFKNLPVEFETGGGGDNVGSGGRDVTGSVPDGRAVEFKAGAVGMSGGRLRLRLGSGRLVGSTGGIEMLALGNGRVRDGGSNEGKDSDGIGRDNEVGLAVEVGAALELEILALDAGGRDSIGDEGTESVGSITEGLPEGPPKLRDAEAEADGRLTHVEGRGIPDGRLHVIFCAVAVVETLNRANPTAASMVIVRRALPKKHSALNATHSAPMCFSEFLYITKSLK